MNGAAAAVLAVGVAAVWLGSVALLRLRPLARVHAVSFVNMVGGGAITLAAWLSEGATPRTAKILLVWVVLLLTGALSSHVTGRAIHLRSGERR